MSYGSPHISGPGKNARAEDPGEYNQRRRLQVINDSRELAREYISVADAGLTDSDGDPVVTYEQAFAVTRAYVDDLRWPIVDAEESDLEQLQSRVEELEAEREAQQGLGALGALSDLSDEQLEAAANDDALLAKLIELRTAV